MKRHFKRLAALMLALIVMSASITVPVSALEVEETQVQPRWQHVTSVGLILNVESNPIYISVSVAGATGTTYSNGTVRLLRDGVQIAKWTGLSATTPFFNFSNNSITRRSGSYELQFSIVATRNGVSETISSFKTNSY